MSCGISSSFPEVFPTSGQVTHVLLTRPPLDSGSCPPGLARLACVKHAASVHSEPGSNSPLKSVPTPTAEAGDGRSESILLFSDRKTLVFEKPGKRRLARSTQFSRNRIPGVRNPPADDAVLPASTPRIIRQKANDQYRRIRPPPSTNLFAASERHRAGRPFRKNRKPLRGREI
jgi:hypothetical protein